MDTVVQLSFGGQLPALRLLERDGERPLLAPQPFVTAVAQHLPAVGEPLLEHLLGAAGAQGGGVVLAAGADVGDPSLGFTILCVTLHKTTGDTVPPPISVGVALVAGSSHSGKIEGGVDAGVSRDVAVRRPVLDGA